VASKKSNSEASSREANVLLEFRMVDPMSAEVLDANSEDVIDAVINHAADLALGPALAVNPHTCSIKLRFDVLAEDDAGIYERVSKVVGIIVRETDLELVVSRSSVEAHDDADAHTGEFAAA
jgi:hypothetical protein